MNARPLLYACALACVIFVPACSPSPEEEERSEAEPRCAVLCEEDLCGEARAECIDECVVQTAGLENLCAQCLVQESWLQSYPVLDDGRYCDSGVGFWRICDTAFSCSSDQEGICDTDLPLACELGFGSLDACADFCN